MQPVTADPRYAPLRRALERQYRLETVLQETADGAVYIAVDVTLDRRVTIKAIDPVLAGEHRTEAFRREARVLAAVRHPAIPAVHHAGPIERYLHVVVEHDGRDTLEARLAEAAMTREEVIRLGVQVLGALEALHAAGFAHRSVRASHVLVADGRYVLDGFAQSGPLLGPEDTGKDLRALGALLSEAAGSLGRRRLPRDLRRLLRRSTGAAPGGRHPSAAEWRAGLTGVSSWSIRWRPALAVAACLALALAAWRGVSARAGSSDAGPAPSLHRQLAILPLEVDGGQPLDPLGSNLAHLVQLNLDNLPGLELMSRHQVESWLEEQGDDALGVAGVDAARDLGVHWVARGLVDRHPGDVLRVRLALYDSLGAEDTLPEVRGPAHDLAALGDSVTLQLIRVVAPRADSLYEPAPGLTGVPLPALKAFLRGEGAFARDAWGLAQRHYEVALAIDSTFALAEWRLANVKHWRRLPYEHDLGALHRRHSARLRPRDRLLLEALLEPDLALRLARLESAIALVPADGYAWLLYGEELFHRGPLVGRELDEAVRAMSGAVARDPSLGLAYDHLVLSATRAGRRSEARLALDRRRALAAPSRPDDIDMVPFLELVYDERFAGWKAWLRHKVVAWRRDGRTLAGVERVARMGIPWLDMPATQLRYCDVLLRAGGRSAETWATAHEGKGLAWFALGRPAAAFAELDSAAALHDSPEARLQQAEWRVLPAAFGMSDGSSREWRQRLEAMAGDPAVGDRAVWALGLAAQAEGDTADAARWLALLDSGTPLRALLEANDAALRGDYALALARSDAVRIPFKSTRPPDAFAGAAYHLLRGEWHLALGDRARADREWRWYEASDIEGWPTGLAQANEVDAALGVYARLKRARAALVPGASAADSSRACRQLRRVAELWREAEPALALLVREAATLASGCPR